MNQDEIVRQINFFLHESASALAKWLNCILPHVDQSWWEDCVLANLTYEQRENAVRYNYENLEEFDLAALLRIANRSWYDFRTVEYLPSSERECVREMIIIRNNWAHCGAKLPNRDSIIHDLGIIRQFLGQVGYIGTAITELSQLISLLEETDSLSYEGMNAENISASAVGKAEEDILPGSLVSIVSSPDTLGIVRSIVSMGDIVKYSVFANNSTRTYYSGQIKAFVESPACQWVDLETFQSYLTAYHINHPSAQNLYS